MVKRWIPQLGAAAMLAIVFSAGVAACSSAGSAPRESYAALPSPAPFLAIPSPAPLPAARAVNDQTSSDSSLGKGRTAQQRVVLKNATLSLTVTSASQVIAQVTQLAETSGGWVVASNVTSAQLTQGDAAHATINIRIPADQFTTALAQIRAAAISVDSEVITGDDVTQKYVDLTSQVTNLQSTEAQLQKIMASAVTITDVLAVQNQLTTVQGQLETIQGQLKYYSEAAAFSLINLTLVQKATPIILPTAMPKPLGLVDWQPQAIAQSAVETLVTLVQIIISLLIWVVVFGLPLGLIAGIGYAIWRWIQRRTKRVA